jgi:hypothetical protein
MTFDDLDNGGHNLVHSLWYAELTVAQYLLRIQRGPWFGDRSPLPMRLWLK